MDVFYDADQNISMFFSILHSSGVLFICIYNLKFVHGAVEIPVLDVLLFHLLVVAQMNVKLYLVYGVRFP